MQGNKNENMRNLDDQTGALKNNERDILIEGDIICLVKNVVL